jgi:hypothetical protein
MKKCPQCGREYDTSMMFCLDDGAELLYGPAASDEPRTAILHETASPGEATTPAHIHTTEQTVFLPSGNTEVPKTRGFDKRLLLTPVALVVILFSGFLGYRYFSVSGQIGSIAVMPFVNETGNADVEYLAEGMTETLIKGLSNIPVRLLDELQAESARRYVSSSALAIAYGAVGEKDKAFALLEKDVAERASRPSVFSVNPVWDDLRDDPRFAALIRKVEQSKLD